MNKPDTIDEYIERFPNNVQGLLREVRSSIKSVIPQATEGISYGIPTFYVNGKYLVYFAGFKNHISVYPATTPAVARVRGLSVYQVSKGTLKFPLNDPIPFELLKQFVTYRMEEEKLKNTKENKRKEGGEQ